MQSDPPVDEQAPTLRSALVDLSDFSLDDLGRLPPNALADSLRRILTECAAQPHYYGQNFQSSI